MPDGTLFEPLTADEKVTAADCKAEAKTKRPIIPVPASASPQRYRHPKYGPPTAQWEYQVASGDLAGYACRFDFVREDRTPDKLVLPITYCDLGERGFGWTAKGIPAPRPLCRLPDILARKGVPKLVCEGEKAADAGARWFPDYVATTPMHGAKSPHKTDWTPMAGEPVIIWPDNDTAGADFAQQVATLARQAGASLAAIVDVPKEWPQGWDLADPLPEGIDPAFIYQLLAEAQEIPALIAPMPVEPRLLVQSGDLPATARELRDLFAKCGYLFDRDGPVKVVQPANGGPMVATGLTPNNVVVEAHRLCQPVKMNEEGKLYPVTLPDRVARMYLDMRGEWHMPPLTGISTAPLLFGDGGIHSAVGYDPKSGLWCCKVPPLVVPTQIGREDAIAALRVLRDAFKTFPFADSQRQHDPVLGVDVIDLDYPSGRDESAFLVGLLTALCRPSLWLAPGFMVVAPQGGIRRSW